VSACLILGGIVHWWLTDPVANGTTLVIAVFGGGFALIRFRFIPRERRRETLHAMQDLYERSRDMRRDVLGKLPPFLLDGRSALWEVVQHDPRRADLQAELERWTEPTDTAAHEILDNEAKFRSVLWAIAEIRRISTQGEYEERELLEKATKLVNELNDFAQLVELKLFDQGEVFAQLHRSVAATGKALEPVIWERNLLHARWGLRILRLLIRAEHYNDVSRGHQSLALVWERRAATCEPSRVFIRAALYRDVYGREAETSRLAEMPRFARLAIWLSGSWRKNIWHSYGGRRLRHHIKAEGSLVGSLQYAVATKRKPLDLTWNLADINRELEQRWRIGVAKPVAD
jgi:hypothetical protein